MLCNMRKFYHLQGQCVFRSQVFPLTFLINRGNYAYQLGVLQSYCHENPGAIWICKPGENSNQGQGITVEKDFEHLKIRVSQFVKLAEKKARDRVGKNILSEVELNEVIELQNSNGLKVDPTDFESERKDVQEGVTKLHDMHSLIVQRYIDKPLLINKRKFDIRAFAMLTCTDGIARGYFYEDGYIRTSSKEFSIANSKLKNKFVHLTNDAIQKTS